MKFGSLFSGIGGFDLGFERAGIEGAWQVEKDKDCNRVLSNRFPKIERFSDVTECERMPAVDVLCGGFPCQDVSVAGRREGLAGERSGLWFDFLRIIESNLPRIVVVENVPGLLSSNGGRDFAVILRGLVECGYCVAWRVLDAQYDGVAQRRRRLFIVGSLGNGSCSEILFEREGSNGNPPTRREARERVAPILEIGARTNGDGNRDGDGIGIDGDPMFTLQAGKQHGVCGALQVHARRHGHAMTTQQAAESGHIVTHALTSEGSDASEDGTGRGTPLCLTPWDAQTKRIHSDDGLAPALASSNQAGGQRVPYVAVDRLKHHRFNCLTCGQWFGVNDYESNTVTCPKCGETHIDKITDILDDPEIADCLTQNYGKQPDSTNRNAGPVNLIAFSSKDHGADAGEIAPTLRSMNYDKSHINGGGQVAIAFAQNQRDEVRVQGDGEISGALASEPGMKQQTYIAFTERTRAEGRTFESQEELAYALTNPGGGGRAHSRSIAGECGVRRLTPRECERLQGFPDDWTLYDAEGREISDSARYRMLGNAVAVPCAEWLGHRINAVIG